ncbi:NirD/YgiW/YdeI family stress tolerance protein [Pusillimonas caeni]|uniref:YgiW/YdeI family stress tolerance OB fold protein n=1 Tax=Pusillimonas caeni TaxID=1348472 RepID=UPI000E59BBCF|nr:NirD/YgiW/YdeI family stress tolerance protein [Pusillimonas caeni]TFL13052.1 NirD/YgiW/YdeI family stress tolerance protein [Pusillimonas caeni]
MSAPSKSRLFFIGALLAGATAAPAYAQYTGPTEGGRAQNTVAAILANPTDDQQITMQGQLLRKIGKEKYIFSDGTAEIVAEIDDDDFPREPVDEKTKVEIHGEVDTGLRRPPEIEVDSIRVVK